jgi:hypothetical protein
MKQYLKEPVKEVAIKDPEIFTVFAAKSPFISGVPEPDAIYNLSFSSVLMLKDLLQIQLLYYLRNFRKINILHFGQMLYY